MLLCCTKRARAQFKKDSTCNGTLVGVIQDSAHNYVMQSATLAVYRNADSALISYQLSNNFGEFSFKELPTGIELRLVASYIGYKNTYKKFTIPIKEKEIDLRRLNMDRMEEGEQTGLADVVVKSSPPVQINGDTLEFNADAFKMDPNAVAEDLLRKLPGVVVWGDGSITVNGKEVSEVLVNGKPFFGGDTRVATQNLPKQAVKKIQVYQQSTNESNPLDSTTKVNIQLKKGQEKGKFGKLAAGVGSDKHYEADANLNFFTNNTQLGLVGGLNDINKITNDVSTLMRNSTYKGVGANIDYQPDFSMKGLNLPKAAGFIFQHDFIDHPDYYQNDRLKSNYFLHSNAQKINTQTKKITSLGTDSIQILQSNNTGKHSQTGQKFSSNYNKHQEAYTYDFNLAVQSNVINNYNKDHSQLINQDDKTQSINNAENSSHSNSQNASLQAHITHRGNTYFTGKENNAWDISYSFNIDQNEDKKLTKTNFISLNDKLQNQYINRKYNYRNSGTNQQLILSYGSLSKWVLPNWMQSLKTTVKNSVNIFSHKQEGDVQDFDTLTGKYKKNSNLSGRNDYTGVDERPALEFSKNFNKGLANRFRKNISITVNAQGQFFYQKNNSVHKFQQITQNYQRFVPSVKIAYLNDQYGTFSDNYTLVFNTGASFPVIEQLAPLVDSVNLYYIQRGNRDLRPSYKRELSFNFHHSSYTSKNPFNYNLSIITGKTHDNFADSSVTDTLGRSTHYTVNADGYQYLNGNIRLNKAIQFTNHQFQISYDAGITLSRNPSYINSVFNFSRSLSSSHALSINYNLRDVLAVNLMENYSFYRSKQIGASDYLFKNGTTITRFSTSVKCTKKLTIGSNITYNHTTATSTPATNFTIWNAQVYYRFFRANNLELKFAALDLLHQNTNIINYGYNNVISYGAVNVLQNYYMVTLSFFPRKFGR